MVNLKKGFILFYFFQKQLLTWSQNIVMKKNVCLSRYAWFKLYSHLGFKYQLKGTDHVQIETDVLASVLWVFDN